MQEIIKWEQENILSEQKIIKSEQKPIDSVDPIHLKSQSVYCNHYCLRIKLDRSIWSSVPFGHFELG